MASISIRSLIRLSLGTALVCAASAVGAVPMIAQEQASFGLDRVSGFNTPYLAQSFVQQQDNIIGAGLFLQPNFGNQLPGHITIELWAALPDPSNPNNKPLASGTSKETDAGNFANVSWALLDIDPEATYYLVFSSNNPTLGLGGLTTNPYPRGQVFAGAEGFNSFDQFDYTFRTYFDDQTTSVPEPGTLALLGLALVGATLTRRRKAA